MLLVDAWYQVGLHLPVRLSEAPRSNELLFQISLENDFF